MSLNSPVFKAPAIVLQEAVQQGILPFKLLPHTRV